MRHALMRERLAGEDDQEQINLRRVPESYPQLSFLKCLKTFEAGNEERHGKYVVAIYKWDKDRENTRDGEKISFQYGTSPDLGGAPYGLPTITRSPAKTQAVVPPQTDDGDLRKHMIIDSETGDVFGMGHDSVESMQTKK